MKVASSSVVPLPSAKLKMEDRKRAAGQSIDDLAPPAKRQTTNGTKREAADSDMPWKDAIEEYQKDAIYRQMLEYKREKAALDSQLRDVQKRSVDHDDHMRVVDAWWSQLLEEVTLLAQNVAPQPYELRDLPPDGDDEEEAMFPTALYFKNGSEFTDHLAKKSKEIKAKVMELFGYLNKAPDRTTSPELESLQKSLTTLLASQKEQLVKYDRLRREKEDLSSRLETASLRYLKAEKKIDRLKSEPVAKLEAQATAVGQKQSASESDNSNAMNGVEHSTVATEATALAYKEAQVSLDKQKEQLDSLVTENKALTEQLTAANIKLTNLADDDYARTDLFKNFRSSHEDLIKRINHLESINIQLREEAEKSQAERTAVRSQLEAENENVRAELEGQVQRIDADLTRIRSARDELIADQSTRKAHQDQEKGAMEQMRELCSTKDDWIVGLESKVERLLAQIEEKSTVTSPDVDAMDIEELRSKYITLEQNFASVNNELPAMERAYKRTVAMASKKVMDFSALEEKVTMLIAEKTKADQKYFAARKDMDTRLAEVRSLRAQNAKSSEIISQLKDVEASLRSLIITTEKEMSELRESNTVLSTENKRASTISTEATSKLDALKAQVTELTALLKTKDSSYSAAKHHIRAMEVDHEKLQAKYEQVSKEKEMWKLKSYSNASPQEEEFRKLALCDVCKTNFKNTAIKTCGHLFCRACVDDRIANRMRKCPNCAKPFDKTDVMPVHM